MTGEYQIVLADLRERTRRFGFIATIGLAAFLGYQIVGGFFHLRLGSYRGVLNSAWIGTLTALTLTFFLSLVGFFLVRGSIERDRLTGVGQVLASTPI
ncbi:MAG: Tat pathway signal protein, partial [Spirochaetaceae bacterium]